MKEFLLNKQDSLSETYSSDKQPLGDLGIFARDCGCPLEGAISKIRLRFGIAGLKVVTKGIIFLDVFPFVL